MELSTSTLSIGECCPAVIVFTMDIYKQTKKYYKFLRNSLEGINKKKDSSLFVSWDGNKMSSSMVTGQIRPYWGKSVGFTERQPTFNVKIRKFAITKA